jgi:nucleotide-binding universal stress UspA family protein
MTTLQLVPATALAERPTRALFERVVLAIDFGSASLGAARWSTTNVAPHTHAILSHVVPLAERSDHDPETMTAQLETLDRVVPTLSGGLDGFGATLELASARTVLRVGRPSQWLSAIAHGAEASLVVLGRRGAANRKRIGEPNVIERLARRTSASVLVVPEGTTEPPRHIVAAVDEGGSAPAVLRVARALSHLHECPLVVLYVSPPTTGEYDRVMTSARNMLAGTRSVRLAAPLADPNAAPASATRWLRELARSDDASGLARVKTTVGDPAREIASVALDYGSALVVVGKRGADGAPLGSIGSVARELLTRAPVPVLAVSV